MHTPDEGEFKNRASISQSLTVIEDSNCGEDDCHKLSNSYKNNSILKLQEEARILKEAHKYLKIFEGFLSIYTIRNNELKNEKLKIHNMTSDLKKNIESLKRNQKRQQAQIHILQFNNISMKTKLEEMWFDRQHQCKSNETVEAPKLKAQNTLMASHMDGSVSVEQENIDDIQKNTDGSATDYLKQQLEKLKAEHNQLQEKHLAEIQLKMKSINKCLQIAYFFCDTEDEMEQMQCQQQDLENKAQGNSLGVQKITEKKESLEKVLLSLKMVLGKEIESRSAEKDQAEFDHNRLITEAKLLQSEIQKEQDSEDCSALEYLDEGKINGKTIELREKFMTLAKKMETLETELQEHEINTSALKEFTADEKASNE